MRGARMNEFLTKLLRVTFPRVRDFRGLSIVADVKAIYHLVFVSIQFSRN